MVVDPRRRVYPVIMHSSSGTYDIFGPQTLFYESCLQVIPSALLLLASCWCLPQLRRQNIKTLRNGARTVKQVFIAILTATQLALLVAWSVTPPGTYRTSASVPAAVVSFSASLALLCLSSVEHTRTVRPSTIISSYLFFSLLLNIPQTRTLWIHAGANRTVPGIFTASLAAKVVVLCLEARSKTRSLFPVYRIYSPEALAGTYDRTMLWWLNPLFLQGYRSSISNDKLHNADLSSHELEQMREIMGQAYVCRRPSPPTAHLTLDRIHQTRPALAMGADQVFEASTSINGDAATLPKRSQALLASPDPKRDLVPGNN